jgi:nucleoside-diphosphate-sugar epimerase
MTILLTGSTGFVGKHIFQNLNEKGYKIKTIGRNVSNDILYNFNLILKNLPDFEIVIHSAGKAHILDESYSKNNSQFDFNSIGTDFLLKSLSESKIPRYFILISSVSVYGLDAGELINENFPLSANDAYGKSKIETENLVINWCKVNKVTLTILRLPLVFGLNPPGNLGIMLNAIKKGIYFNINSGIAKKSIILVTDISKFILLSYKTGGIYNLTDGYNPTFYELSKHIAKQFEKNYIFSIPLFLINPIAKLGDILNHKFPINTKKVKKMTSTLTFDDTKAQKTFEWEPTPILNYNFYQNHIN